MSQSIAVTVTNTNDNAPVITSNGGLATAALSITENSLAVTTVTATDLDAGSVLTYTLAGGADQAKFIINSVTGINDDIQSTVVGTAGITVVSAGVAFIRGADVMIMDSQYDAAEYETHVGWGHSCVDDVADLATRAGVKQLFLFHHDPQHDDERISRMLAHARQLVGNGTLVEAAREGLEVVLNG